MVLVHTPSRSAELGTATNSKIQRLVSPHENATTTLQYSLQATFVVVNPALCHRRLGSVNVDMCTDCVASGEQRVCRPLHGNVSSVPCLCRT